MVLPIIQRGNKTARSPLTGIAESYYFKTNRVQKAPFNLVAPYEARYGKCEYSPHGKPYYGSVFEDATQIYNLYYQDPIMVRCSNRAYDKLKGKLYQNVSLGVDIAEFRQSFNMIASRAGQLYAFSRYLKRFDFEKASAALGKAIVPPGASPKKSFASNFLEYHFGWEPLVKDIYDALEVVSDPLKSFTMERAGASERFSGPYSINYGSVSQIGYAAESYTVTMGCQINAIRDQYMHSLEQFGLINPAVILWELVPFSFVVDWFGNVGSVLSSLSDYAGMTLSNSFTTRRYTVAKTYENSVNAGYAPTPGYSNLKCGASGSWTRRDGGLTLPVFSVKKLRLPSKTRSATAVSLLTQLLSKR